MRKLTSFTFISLNGFFKGLNDDISWHKYGEEENKFSQESLQSKNIILFGRKTYALFYSFWSSPTAANSFPEVAKGLHRAQKIVFSTTLQEAEWNNTTVMSGDIVEQIKDLKQTPGNDLTLLGSGSILSQFSDTNLINEYKIMMDPVAIGQGTPLFHGIKKQLNVTLKETRVFESGGAVLLTYVPQIN